MRASSGREAMYALLAVLCCVVLGVQGFFLGQLTRLPTTTRQRGPSSARRCRAPRLAVMPPGKPGGGAGSAAAGGDDNGAGFGGDGKNRITRAPLRITPNFQPQEKRRPKTVADDEDIAYGAFLTEESFDIAVMAWAEFSDWLRRTIERNVDGAQFEFDIRQWLSSIRKWWIRAVEMDVQAKAELFRLYDRGMQERDAWENQAVKVDARVEEEWDSIYVECQDCFEHSSSSSSSSVKPLETSGMGLGRARSPSYSGMRREGPWSASSSAISAFDVYHAEGEEREGEEEVEDEEEEDGGEREIEGGVESEGFDEEDIIDCAIRGRWTFKNNDDPPHFSPQ